MELNEYQREAASTAIYPHIGDNPYYPALGLCGEAGEVANKIKKIMRDGTPKADSRAAIAQELGDCLWYVAMVADEFDLALSYIATLNVMKLRHRNDLGTLGGSGDDR